MPTRLDQDDPLEDFLRREMVLEGAAKVVHVAGGGPAVIVMAEMPGISPHGVVTAHLIDESGQPTLAVRDEILAFFTQRLRPGDRT